MTKSKNQSWEAILSKAVETYGEDGVLADYIRARFKNHGDLLAQFIACEAHDVFSEEATAEENVKEIAKAMLDGAKQLLAVGETIMAQKPPSNKRISPVAALEDAFRKAAEDRHAKDGDLEFDGGATVSLSDDHGDGFQGAYVQGWKYIPQSDLTDAERKRFKKLLAPEPEG